MKKRMIRAVSGTRADFADALHETDHKMSIVYARDKIDKVTNITLSGMRVTALRNGGYAVSSFSDPTQLDAKIASTTDEAQTLSNFARNNRLAPAPVVVDDVKPNPKIDPRTVSFDEKCALIREYTKLILSHPAIRSTMLSYSEAIREKIYVNSEGTAITEEILLCRLGGRIIAQDGSRTESIGFSLGYDCDYSRLIDRQEVVERQTRAVVDLLKAVPVEPGVHRVLCDQDLAGIFIHEAFGHLSESDDVINNVSLRDVVRLGKVIGRPILNIIDQGNLPGAPGTYAYDDEGVPGSRTYIVKDGILTGRMYSRLGAHQLGGKPTGNFRATDYRFMPIVRMSNIFIDKGKSTFQEMLASIDNGLYLHGGKGGQTMGDIFTFGAQYGFEVKGGKPGRMVKDINISGNVFETLGNIEMVGDDFKMGEWGGCGKTRAGLFDMQMLDKSGTGGPHIVISKVVVGG